MAESEDRIFGDLTRPRLKGRVAATPDPGQQLTPAVQALRPQRSAQPGPDPSYADQLAQWLYAKGTANLPANMEPGLRNTLEGAANLYNQWTPTGSFEGGIRSGMQGDAAGFVRGILSAAPIPGAPAGKAAKSIAENKLEKWISSGQPVRMFHGTPEAAVQSIKETGLRPLGGIGADAWAKKAGMPVQEFQSRDPSVFLSDNLDAAQMFASKATAAQPGPLGNAAILSIDVPPEFASRLLPDEMTHGTFGGPAEYSFRYPGAIPPEWVKRNHITFGDEDALPPAVMQPSTASAPRRAQALPQAQTMLPSDPGWIPDWMR